MKNLKLLILSVLVLTGSAFAYFNPPTPPKLTRIAINTRNGGLGLLGKDNMLYGCDFTFATLNGNGGHPGRYDDISSYQGQGLGVRTSDKMLVAIVPAPENERPLDGNPKGKYIAYDRETQALWYIGLDDLVYKVGGTSSDSPQPNIKAKALQVCNGQIFIVGLDDSMMKKYVPSAKGDARWQTMVNGVKVLDMFVDRGIDQIHYINQSDRQAWAVHFTPGSAPWQPVAPNPSIKAKSIVGFGGAPFIVAENGSLYAPTNGAWVKAKLAYE